MLPPPPSLARGATKLGRRCRRFSSNAGSRPYALCLPLLSLLLHFASVVVADIRVVVNGHTLSELSDKPAGFGAPLGDEGVRGYLVAAFPHLEACDPLLIDKGALRPSNDSADRAPPPFIVLIRRSPVMAAGAMTRDGDGDGGGKGNHSRADGGGSDGPLRVAGMDPPDASDDDGRGAPPHRSRARPNPTSRTSLPASSSSSAALHATKQQQALRRGRGLLGPSVPVPAGPVPPDGDACTFEQKVRNAQAAGAVGAVVFDSVEEPLIRMVSEAGGKGIDIPAVFVARHTGLSLLNLLAASTPDAPVEVVIDNKDSYPPLFSKLNFTLLGLIVALMVVVVVLGAIFLCTNNRMQAAVELLPAAAAAVLPLTGRRRPPKEVLPLKDVLALPTVRVGGDKKLEGSAGAGKKQQRKKPGDLDDALSFFVPTPPPSPSRAARGYENELCAICLSDFETGDLLKVLPCGGKHAFHVDCITPWLTERARVCPLCKVTISPPARSLPPSLDSSVAGEEEEEDEDEDEEKEEEDAQQVLEEGREGEEARGEDD